MYCGWINQTVDIVLINYLWLMSTRQNHNDCTLQLRKHCTTNSLVLRRVDQLEGVHCTGIRGSLIFRGGFVVNYLRGVDLYSELPLIGPLTLHKTSLSVLIRGAASFLEALYTTVNFLKSGYHLLWNSNRNSFFKTIPSVLIGRVASLQQCICTIQKLGHCEGIALQCIISAVQRLCTSVYYNPLHHSSNLHRVYIEHCFVTLHFLSTDPNFCVIASLPHKIHFYKQENFLQVRNILTTNLQPMATNNV